MKLFSGRKAKNKAKLKVEEIKVAGAIIVPSFDDGSGGGIRCVNLYFLVYEEKGKYYELFSNRIIETKEDAMEEGFNCMCFDTPYIEKVKPLSEYLIKKNVKTIERNDLFDFILEMNVQEQIGAIDKEEEPDEEP